VFGPRSLAELGVPFSYKGFMYLEISATFRVDPLDVPVRYGI